MKNKMKILLFCSIFLNIILLLYSVPAIPIKIKFMIINAFGYITPSSAPIIKKHIFIEDYKPLPVLDSTDRRMNKLPLYPVFETHGHLGFPFSENPEEITKKLNDLGIFKFINLSFKTGKEYKNIKLKYNDPKIIHFSAFNWKRLKESENFIQLMLDDLKKDIANGSKGIKLWKDFGLMFKKKNGERLKMNDPILDPLFQECARSKLIIAIHTADPKSFFSPIDEKNERYEELLRHPEWSFASDEFPQLETVLKERDELFARHPNLIFVSLHFAEYANDLNKAEKLLENNKNVYLEFSARIDELGRQPFSTKKFFEKFQDRIFYGTDGTPDKGKYEIYSRFLETNDEYFDYTPPHKPRKGFWKIYGLGLNRQILEKIYFKNANNIFKG